MMLWVLASRGHSPGHVGVLGDISLSEANDNEKDNLFILKKGQIYIKEGTPEKDKTKFDFESKPSFELIISGGGQKQTLKVEIYSEGRIRQYMGFLP